MTVDETNVKKRFEQQAKDGRITCAECLEIGKELGYPTKKIGPMLLEMNIKIVQCQLGCFP
jgi:hypothetical protein